MRIWVAGNGLIDTCIYIPRNRDGWACGSVGRVLVGHTEPHAHPLVPHKLSTAAHT